VSAKVQKVITEKLLPSLSSHGGWLELNRVEGDTAYVVLGGGCQGCASARETLKFGVEAAIKEDVPEIAHVVDETDHTAGDAPYVSG
jgi:Fe/S biogenesis protein NfuA